MSDAPADEAVVLRYAAADGAFLMGVPARDLTVADLRSPELERFGATRPTVVKRLVESGLYTEAAPAAAAKAAKADKRES